MLGHFPTGYDDETMYNIGGRYQEECGYTAGVVVARELFGSAVATAGLDIVANLGNLVQQLPPGHRLTIDRLIAEHTLLPFYEPFMLLERKLAVRDDVAHNRVNARIRSGIGLGTGQERVLEWLRYCPDCAEQDRKEVGEAYWHRVHQIPTTLVCPHHGVFLEDSNVVARGRPSRKFVPAEQAIEIGPKRPLDLTDRCHAELFALARDSAWLLAHPATGLHLALVRQRHRRLLFERDYASPRGRVTARPLMSDIRTFFGDAVLSLLGCALNDDPGSNWVKRLFYRVDNTLPPVHHLLLIHFLGYSMEEYCALSDDVKPFGDGPWPCLNTASEHHNQETVLDCAIRFATVSHGSRQAMRPIGRFTCSCGFVYERTGPDQTSEDRYRYVIVIDRGDVWRDMLRALWFDGSLTMNDLARRLGAGETYIRDQALRLGLPFPRIGGRNAPSGKEQSRRPRQRAPVSQYRHRWMEIRRLHPSASVSALIDLAPAVYAWLYAYDRGWLMTHRPAPRNGVHGHVDWSQRDKELARMVREAAAQLRASPERPRRITVTTIGGAIGHRDMLRKKLCKLPETAQALAEVVETIEQCSIRRLWWTVAQHQQRGTCPTASYLQLEAGLKSVTESPEISAAFQEALRVLSHAKDWEQRALVPEARMTCSCASGQW